MSKHDRLFYMYDSETEGDYDPLPEEDYSKYNSSQMKTSSSLQMILTSIAKARSRDCSYISSG